MTEPLLGALCKIACANADGLLTSATRTIAIAMLLLQSAPFARGRAAQANGNGQRRKGGARSP